MTREDGLYNNVSEFVIEWLKGEDRAFITTQSNCALKTRLMRLAEEYPSEVEIIKINTDGSLYSSVPVKYISVRHPRKVTMTEERKQAAVERLKKARETKRKDGETN